MTVEEVDLHRHRIGSLHEALADVSVRSLHGVRSVNRLHVLHGEFGNQVFHVTDFEGQGPARVAVLLRLSLQVALTSLHPEAAIVSINTRPKTFATFGRTPEIATMVVLASLLILDRLYPLRLHVMMPGTGTTVGMTTLGAPVMMTGVPVTFVTLQRTTLRLLEPIRSKGKAKVKAKERVERNEMVDTSKGARPCRYWVNGHCTKGNDYPDKHEERFRSAQRAAAATQDQAAESADAQATPTDADPPPESSPAAPFGNGKGEEQGEL